MLLEKDLLYLFPEEKKKHKKSLVQSPDSYFVAMDCPGYYKITTIFSHSQKVICMLAVALSPDSLQEEKEGLEKDALSDGSSIQSTPYQAEWETIPIDIFWIWKERKREREIVKPSTLPSQSSKIKMVIVRIIILLTIRQDILIIYQCSYYLPEIGEYHYNILRFDTCKTKIRSYLSTIVRF